MKYTGRMAFVLNELERRNWLQPVHMSSFLEFRDRNIAKGWGNRFRSNARISADMFTSLLSNQRISLTENRAEQEGGHCEGNGSLDPDQEKLDHLIHRSVLRNRLIVYRPFTYKDLKHGTLNGLISDGRYWKASLLERSGIRDGRHPVMKIYIHRGSHALYISEDDDEKCEILLPRTNSYRILRRHLFSRYIEAEAIEK